MTGDRRPAATGGPAGPGGGRRAILAAMDSAIDMSPAAASPRPALGVAWAGRTLDLHPEGVVVDAATATAFVADMHLGKPASFRRLGVPVPDGGAVADLERLSAVLRRTGVERLIVLGDFLHDAAARSPETLAAIEAWRARHPELPVVLVRGNHDERAGDPPASLEIECVTEPWDAGGIACRHHPPATSATPSTAATAAEPPTLCGHLHPVVVLRGRGGRGGRGSAARERCRCFHLMPRTLMLPAFGSFTGGMVVRPRAGDRVFAVGPGVVIEAATA